MAKELNTIGQLIKVSEAIIEKPTLSLKDFGVERIEKNQQLTWTGNVSVLATNSFGAVAASSVAMAGAPVIVGMGNLKGIGIAAVVAGTMAAASGVSATGVGLIVVPFIAAGGYCLYNKKKKEQQEKDRMHQEIIKKQQSAISRLQQINRDLEDRLRTANSNNVHMQTEMDRLKIQIQNLEELLAVLAEQEHNFKAA